MAKTSLKIRSGILLTPQASAPSTPSKGDIYYDSNTDTIQLYTGSVWVALSTGSTGGISTEAKSGDFTAADGKTYLVNTSAARAVTLPAAAANISFRIKDVSGLCNTKNITITRAGSENIEGVGANRVLSADFGSWFFVCDGTDWWML